jgi:hypothetical protein
MNSILYVGHGPIHGDYMGLFVTFILIYLAIYFFLIKPKNEIKQERTEFSWMQFKSAFRDLISLSFRSFFNRK